MGAKPRVVIVGGGFAGLNAARELKGVDADVMLIDRRNHHLFQPLLYQVATAVLNPSDIAAPIRRLVSKHGVETQLAEVRSIDVENRKVMLVDGEVPYDFLVLASGATHSYFGHDEWAQYSMGLKSIEDAVEIRRRVLIAFEAAERLEPARRGPWMTFVIVGAGPTGVELAGAFADIARHSLRRDFAHIDPSKSRIIVLEGVDHVLPTYPERLSLAARRQLEKLGVEVQTNTLVTGIDDDGVWIGNKRIEARTVLWAAGVAASPLARSLGAPLDRAGRVKVSPWLTVPANPEIFVVGDLASLVDVEGKPIPGVAPAAMQMGAHAAKNIKRAMAGKPMKAFTYFDRGNFSVVGRGAAVGLLLGKIPLSGFVAWFSWLFIHLLFLVGFKNRVSVLLSWAYSFFTLRRGARLITGPPPHLDREAGEEVVGAAYPSLMHREQSTPPPL